MPARFFSFGSFKLVPDQRRLLRGDVPVRLGTRALAILSVLVEHAGELISKQDLISRVWPDTFVDESNLKVNIAALRKALDGDDTQLSHIATVSGRGYSFVAPVIVGELENSLENRRRVSNLPISTKHIIGRCEVIQQVTGELSRCRFLTIVGSGGIGKTTVATAVAESLLQAYEHGICFMDFSSLNDPSRVSYAVCAALRIPTTIENANDQLKSHLQNREILLVFDTCEHILSAAAECAELIQSCCPRVDILAISREPLGAAGERTYRLPPLGVPPEDTKLTADEI
jgi:DNA-binding winged helix-turn-helix (wHTH) protein